MRELSNDEGFELPDLGPAEGDPSDPGGVDLDLDLSMDGGFDFLDTEAVDLEGGDEMPAPPGTEGMTDDDIAEFRARWADVQASFIDDPHRACEQADNLVDLVLNRLTARFARERDQLVRAWDHGNERKDTEQLRVAMKGYRGLIDRLLETRF